MQVKHRNTNIYIIFMTDKELLHNYLNDSAEQRERKLSVTI